MSTRVDSVEGWRIVEGAHADFARHRRDGVDVWTVLSIAGLIGLVIVIGLGYSGCS